MKITCGLAALALVALTASDGFAQSRAMGSFHGLFTAHIGAAAGGERVGGETHRPASSVSVQERNGWGAELDFGRTSDARSGVQILDLTTYMVNALWMKPERNHSPVWPGRRRHHADQRLRLAMQPPGDHL